MCARCDNLRRSRGLFRRRHRLDAIRVRNLVERLQVSLAGGFFDGFQMNFLVKPIDNLEAFIGLCVGRIKAAKVGLGPSRGAVNFKRQFFTKVFAIQ